MTTLYYQYLVSSQKRPGGPWWSKTFKTSSEANSFFQAMKPFLRRYALTNEIEEKGQIDLMPPENVEIFEI